MGKGRSRKQASEAIEKRKALRNLLGNKLDSDLIVIFAYLYRDVMLDMIMNCDIAEIEYAIKQGERIE